MSTLSLEQQIASDGATWLDRELMAKGDIDIDAVGFGREVAKAIEQRAVRLAEMGHVRPRPDGEVVHPGNLLATLERQEVERVGRDMASARGLPFQPVRAGEYVSGKLVSSANLASGRYAMINGGATRTCSKIRPLLRPQHETRSAWRMGYRGLAAALAVAWDTQVSPVDVRTLTKAQMTRDGEGSFFYRDRTKTGEAAVGTLSRRTSGCLRHTWRPCRRTFSPLRRSSTRAAVRLALKGVRPRCPAPYTKDTLGDDFREVRVAVFGKSEAGKRVAT